MQPATIRAATPSDVHDIHAVINDGAAAYKGIIPADRWHEPYMSLAELESEIEAGVEFSCFVEHGAVLGVMGIQDRGPVVLIRHAYVRTDARRRGIGGRLLRALTATTSRPILIGTWKAAAWAIAFYQAHGFMLLDERQARLLLERFWNVPVRQMDTSVVLANDPSALGASFVAR
ncbi:MAG: N-acetyltransferase family protein [Vicinamibacterales bacterium]